MNHAILLAGGLSSRMGSNKALLTYDDKTVLEHMWQLMAKTNITQRWVSGDYPDYPCIHDRLKMVGPIGAIDALFNHVDLNQKSYLFLPVDMPLLTPSILQTLLNQAHTADVVYFDHHVLPFVLNDSQTVRDRLEPLVNQPPPLNISLKQFFTGLRQKILPLTPELANNFINLNTPADLRNLDSDCFKTTV